MWQPQAHAKSSKKESLAGGSVMLRCRTLKVTQVKLQRQRRAKSSAIQCVDCWHQAQKSFEKPISQSKAITVAILAATIRG